MARNLYSQEPVVINSVYKDTQSSPTKKYLEIATTNENKLKEIRRILKDFEIIGKSLDIEEIQSLNWSRVASAKAKAAYEANGYNPILVEDTSLEVKGLDGFPGTYVNDFFSTASMRKEVAQNWLNGKDRSAIAKVTLAIFDGKEAFIFEGNCEGKISETPMGMNGFGWDDIFIPNGQPKGEKKTFAQMNSEQKDKYSMRVNALKKFLKSPPVLNYKVFKLLEPFDQEMQRVRLKELKDETAIKFAYTLEAIEGDNEANNLLTAPNYSEVYLEENAYFSRFLQKKNSKSIGLMLTDTDRTHIKLQKNGYPVLWQMGPERRHLALAERVEYFTENQSKDAHKILDELENKKESFPKRSNKRSITIDRSLGFVGGDVVTRASAVKEIGYKKFASEKEVSRTKASKSGLFNIIGKYARSIYSIGCLPWVSGWRDVIITGAVGHMPVFVHRNNLNAIDLQNQIDLINDAKKAIKSLGLSKKALERAYNNIGAAVGTNPVEDRKKARRLYDEAGVKLFRIYTINSDPRVVQTARAIREELGEDVEIFVGQLVDKRQAYELIVDDIKIDGLIIGHGGGRVCTSATNGMALSTLEEIYSIVTDSAFNNTSVLVEGGLGSHIGSSLIMGVDGILRNGQFASCVIEQGDLFFEHMNGKPCQPYHGSASAATMIIESYNPENAKGRLFASGRAKNVEGKPGYIYYEEKGNSMSFYVNEFKHYAARTLADLGVESIWELREFVANTDEEIFREVTPEASVVSGAWRN